MLGFNGNVPLFSIVSQDMSQYDMFYVCFRKLLFILLRESKKKINSVMDIECIRDILSIHLHIFLCLINYEPIS